MKHSLIRDIILFLVDYSPRIDIVSSQYIMHEMVEYAAYNQPEAVMKLKSNTPIHQ